MKLCAYHNKGVPARIKPHEFYSAGCERCEEKRAAGIVTGTEPPPRSRKDWQKFRWGRGRLRA